MKTVYLGMGSNLGDRVGYLDFAIECLDRSPNVVVTKISTIIETPPLPGGPAQGFYLNQVVCIETNLGAHELLRYIQEIENEGQRERNIKWGPRTIDIDILFYGDEIIHDQVLDVPHIEVQNRIFVLEPLVELNAEFMHPELKLTALEMLHSLQKNSSLGELEVS